MLGWFRKPVFPGWGERVFWVNTIRGDLDEIAPRKVNLQANQSTVNASVPKGIINALRQLLGYEPSIFSEAKITYI